MSSASRMKREMSSGSISTLTPADRAEVERFAEFLRDSATMTQAELVAKYGEYLGIVTEATAPGQPANPPQP